MELRFLPPNQLMVLTSIAIYEFTYFDMAKYYQMADKKGFAQFINKMFLEEQHSLGKIFYKTSLNISSTYEWELGILKGLGAIVQLF